MCFSHIVACSYIIFINYHFNCSVLRTCFKKHPFNVGISKNKQNSKWLNWNLEVIAVHLKYLQHVLTTVFCHNRIITRQQPVSWVRKAKKKKYCIYCTSFAEHIRGPRGKKDISVDHNFYSFDRTIRRFKLINLITN